MKIFKNNIFIFEIQFYFDNDLIYFINFFNKIRFYLLKIFEFFFNKFIITIFIRILIKFIKLLIIIFFKKFNLSILSLFLLLL